MKIENKSYQIPISDERKTAIFPDRGMSPVQRKK